MLWSETLRPKSCGIGSDGGRRRDAHPAGAEAGATTPAGFFGLNYYFRDITSGDVLYLKKSGAKTVRWRMNWSNIEPSSGHFDWSAADAVVGDLAAQGIRVLPVMWGSPGWVASSAITPPIGTQKQRDAWSGFLRAAIKRYGPQGNYWTGAYRTQHSGKTPLPIDTWQIWNEANLSRAMNPPTPSTYAKLLTLSHTVIKQADPKAKVMFAGLLSHPNGATAWDFLRGVYQQPGARNAFDIMASNAYSSSVSRMLDDLSRIRQTMAANGQGPKPLGSPKSAGARTRSPPPTLGRRRACRARGRSWCRPSTRWSKSASAWRIGKVLWWNFRDPAGGESSNCSFCTSAGLLTNDFKTKPAWSAFLSFTGG